jgi:hypothetical protein
VPRLTLLKCLVEKEKEKVKAKGEKVIDEENQEKIKDKL